MSRPLLCSFNDTIQQKSSQTAALWWNNSVDSALLRGQRRGSVTTGVLPVPLGLPT